MADKKKYRYERKYLLDRDTAYLFKQRISYVLKPDNAGIDGLYHISSLYFDDQYKSSFFDKQNGVLRRDKFRARFYDYNKDLIRFECKHKQGEMICKESKIITSEQYERMCMGEYDFMKSDQNPAVRKFFTAHLLRHMLPSVMIDYDRQAYIHPAGNVRITFDTDLTASLPESEQVYTIISEKNVIMEVKYDNFIPSYINALITGEQFSQQLSISKFAMGKLSLQGVFNINIR